MAAAEVGVLAAEDQPLMAALEEAETVAHWRPVMVMLAQSISVVEVVAEPHTLPHLLLYQLAGQAALE
jgi:hypothetical protein